MTQELCDQPLQEAEWFVRAEGARSISRREREIVKLVSLGKRNKEVATLLGISEATVETHRKNVMNKLRLDSLADLVRYAVRNNVISA